jgi:catechol 2,3-dioxygenase-like lactoylglutathione lyase family enzyme
MSLVFSHVALNCRDPLATERFYVKHFGFTRARVIPLGAEQIVFLKAGSVYLELFQAKGDPPGPALEKDGPAYRGVRHIAFQVKDVNAIGSTDAANRRKTRARIKSQAVPRVCRHFAVVDLGDITDSTVECRRDCAGDRT